MAVNQTADNEMFSAFKGECPHTTFGNYSLVETFTGNENETVDYNGLFEILNMNTGMDKMVTYITFSQPVVELEMITFEVRSNFKICFLFLDRQSIVSKTCFLFQDVTGTELELTSAPNVLKAIVSGMTSNIPRIRIAYDGPAINRPCPVWISCYFCETG